MTTRATEESALQVAERSDDTDVFLLDVRRERDYETWHIDRTHNIPLYDHLLKKEYTKLEASLDNIPRDKMLR